MAAVRFEQAQRFILVKKYFGVMGTLMLKQDSASLAHHLKK